MEVPPPATAFVNDSQLGINAQMQRLHEGKQVWMVNEEDCINMNGPSAPGSKTKKQEAQARLRAQFRTISQPAFAGNTSYGG